MPLPISKMVYAATSAPPGIIGATTASALSFIDGSPQHVAILTAGSCVLGMVSQLSRVTTLRSDSWRKEATKFVMNAGAVWLVAFLLAVEINAEWPEAMIIGLGVGLLGTRALELVERGVSGMIERILGAKFPKSGDDAGADAGAADDKGDQP